MSDTSGTYSHSDALAEIRKWAKTRPSWQQLAIDKLICNGQISQDDLSELEALCLDPHDISSQLSGQELQTENSHSEPISLISIENPQGINALPPNQKLQFEPKGLSIIYGDNGSGKSGYCRILKNACRSLDKKFAIERPVQEDDSVTQSATIRYQLGDKEVLPPMHWIPLSNKNKDLASVSIFDARSAVIHVKDENTIAYTPLPMKVLEELAKICDHLKERLEKRAEDVPSAIGEHNLSEKTPAGKYLKNLSPKSQRKELDSLITLSDEEQDRLETLNTDLAKDSDKVKKRLIDTKSNFESKFAQLKILADMVSDDEIKKFITLRKQHKDAQDAVKVLSDKLFSSSPLPQVGGEVWRSLWEAARRYSEQTKQSFPGDTPDHDLCMLCQQSLKEGAVKRLQTFEDFVKGEVQLQETTIREKLDEFKAELEASALSVDFITEITTLVRDIFKREEFANHLKTFIESLSARRESCLEGNPLQDKAPVFQKEAYDDCLRRINRRIEELSLNHDDPKWRALLKEQRELQDRTELAGMVDGITKEIERQKEIKKIEAAFEATATLKITNKNKALSKKLITDSLRKSFAKELENLKIGSLSLTLRKARDKNAQSFFRIEFTDYPKTPVAGILSEGEHRCVALVAFLAELVTSEKYSGIVFDDPMSSLDHIYRRRVAQRLVDEAVNRQVIVFTHDLSFMFEIERRAEKQNVNVCFQNIYRKMNDPGYVTNELPTKAQNATARVNAIRNLLKKKKGSYNDCSHIERENFAKGTLAQLREAWEQVIADFIRPVMSRFDNSVRVSSIGKLLDLTEDDVKIIKEARSRLSEDLHLSSEVLNPETVKYEELYKETTIILDLIKFMEKRIKAPAGGRKS